ncbi:MAG TPA: hypothetical protein VMT62_17170 [Syntrophorhabdaceae bacterium]|nr:hypothetical protein [Syntrophorhabdaceae bacterium]
MSEAYEVGLLRNVRAPDGKSSVSKDSVGLKRKQARDNKKKGRAGYGSRSPYAEERRNDYDKDPPENKEQESRIDITI